MSVYYSDEAVTLYHGDCLDVLRQIPDGSVDCCVTSPPYFGLRDYGVDGQIGAESSPAEFVERLRVLFAEVRRVLADDGTLWLNLGDSYSFGNTPLHNTNAPNKNRDGSRDNTSEAIGAALKPRKQNSGLPAKNMLGIPWRVVFALQEDGWILRNQIIWHKPNAMPESVTDRLSNKHEHLFMLTKSPCYWFDLDPIREPHTTPDGMGWAANGRGSKFQSDQSSGFGRGHNISSREGLRAAGGHPNGRNPGDVWSIPTVPFPGAHFAVFPPALAERCIQAGCKPGGTVLDPFSGSGTTGMAAAKHGRKYVGIDLNADYLDLSLRTRLAQTALIEDAS